jgi:EAL domain-containing protein (putative c-di-GMP-specific phosphodiesterase class I)
VAFEITETVAVSNLAQALKLMTSLKAAGCRFALDDFGSGVSSFNYLKQLPVDYLKIDGNLVRGIATEAVSCVMVEAINRIGHAMGIETVAEWVENADILEKLRELGVDYGQGFYLGRPLPLGSGAQTL